MTEIYVNVVKELNKIYDVLNKKYFDSELPNVVITIQSGAKKKAYGWFGKDFWEDDKTVSECEEHDTYHEINISAEYLNRPISNICATLQHEMIHLYCAINNIKDCSNHNVYHNKRFKEEAEKRDLLIEKAPTIGWSVTTPSQNFINFIDTINIDKENFAFTRKVFAKKSTDKNDDEKAKTTTYICPFCEAKVRGEIGLNIICGNCKEQMISKK